MQLLRASAAICAVLVTHGCTCSKILQRASSPDGRYVAWVEVGDGCGGATVGYRTDVMIRHRWGRLFGLKDVLVIRRAAKAGLRWKDARHLEIVVYPWDLAQNDVRYFYPRWRDLNISYTMKPASKEELMREPIP